MNPSTIVKNTSGPLRWTVPSATTSGVTYEVSTRPETGELVCNCAARRVCWHIKVVSTGLAGKPHCRITQQPKPAPRLTAAEINASLYG